MPVNIFSCFETKKKLSFDFEDSKVELREDFNQLKILCDNFKTENDLLKINFQKLINNCQ